MIGQIISSIGGLAASIIDSKTQLKLTEAEIKKKQLTGEIDWDIEAIRATQKLMERRVDHTPVLYSPDTSLLW